MNQEKEEVFIVQNVTQGPVCISDLGKKGLTIPALSIHDLSTNDDEEVKKSAGLKSAIRQGLLRWVTKDYAERQEVKKSETARQSIIDELKKEKVRYDDEAPESLTAEELTSEISTAGQANDPVSYAIAFDVWSSQETLRGRDGSPEEFRDKVNDNPSLIKSLIISGTHATVEDMEDEYVEPKLKKISRRNKGVQEPVFEEPLTEIDLTKEL